MPKHTTKDLVDLDDPTNAMKGFLISFRGVRTAIDRARLEQLLEHEQAYFETKGRSPTLSHAVERPGEAPEPRHGVTHASLSARVKKIYAFTFDTNRLRPPHVEMLIDLLENFDWRIPEHPNTRLDQQLAEIAGWPATDASLRAKIRAFLKDYVRRRNLPQPVRGRSAGAANE